MSERSKSSDEKIKEIKQEKIEKRLKKLEEETEKKDRKIEELENEVEKLKANSNAVDSTASSSGSKGISRRSFLKKAGLGFGGLAALMSPVSALDLRSGSLSFADSNKEYFDISPSESVLNINNVDLDLNDRGIQNIGELELPSQSSGQNNHIWVDESNQKLKVRIQGNIYTAAAPSIPARAVEDFEDGDVAEWEQIGDGGIGGIRNVNTPFNGDHAGEKYTNSSGSNLLSYYNNYSADASIETVTMAAYTRWDSPGTTLCFGVTPGTSDGKYVLIGTGYKDGHDWVLMEGDAAGNRTVLDSLDNASANDGAWYETEIEISNDGSVVGKVYNLSKGQRDTRRVELAGTQSTITDYSTLYPAALVFANNSGSNYQMKLDDIRV